ncbi:MAG: FecR domain-containing protein [Flavitalea sp.]
MEERIWLLLSLKLSGEATMEELAELGRLMQERPEMALRADMLGSIWKEKHQGSPARKDDLFNKHLQRLSNHLSEPALQYETAEIPENMQAAVIIPFYKRYRLWLMSGSAAAILFVIFLFVESDPGKKSPHIIAQNTVSTKRGSKTKIQLPDGSQAWLNADSKLTYNESFTGASREVTLSGEAYFDVVKDKAHPFIIHTESIDLKVLGTAFNVRSYANEKNTETALIRGSVEIVLRHNPDKKIILKPFEKLVVQNNEFTVTQEQGGSDISDNDHPLMTLGKVHFQKKDSIATEILWVKDKLAFEGETLENIALKIERWYDVKVVITDDDLKDNTYSGVFEDESLKQVMEALRLTGNFKYQIGKKEVIIKR